MPGGCKVQAVLAGEVGKIDQAAFGDSTLWRTLPVNNWGAVSDLLALLDVLPADSTLTRPSLRAVRRRYPHDLNADFSRPDYAGVSR